MITAFLLIGYAIGVAAAWGLVTRGWPAAAYLATRGWAR